MAPSPWSSGPIHGVLSLPAQVDLEPGPMDYDGMRETLGDGLGGGALFAKPGRLVDRHDPFHVGPELMAVVAAVAMTREPPSWEKVASIE